MPRDDDQSLGDEATLQGGKPAPADERSLGDRSTFGGGDGSSLSDLGEFADLPDHDMEIVDLSSRYKIEETLGKGGMGEVLLATDTRLDRKVAIKRIRGDAASSKAAVARFLTEAKSIAALSHNNVVQVYDYGRDQEGPFLIMEYVAGGSLLDRCKQGAIELEEAVELACQLCDGLGRAHDAGIIHRDIKPANILLTDDSVPKLTDFGLAKAESRDHTMTMAGAVLGTLDFMPPEQRQDASLADARSDLWSLAATLYQMVTGESPKVIRLKKLPAQLQNLLDKALEESKDSRYQAASELKEALQQSLHGGNVATVELEQGVCPSCGRRNEPSRKFCRNTSCAASLQVKCLSCSATIPVWEGVCGECGSIQTDLLEQRREEMGAQKAEAETCLASHDYKRATELAIEIGNEADPRLQQLKSWSAEFIKEVNSTKNSLASTNKTRPEFEQGSFDRNHTGGLQLDPSNADARIAMLSLPPITNSIGIELKLLPPGKYQIASNEIPLHNPLRWLPFIRKLPASETHDHNQVTLTRAFYIGVYEVTQTQYMQVMQTNPSKFKDANNPVEQLSWREAMDFCRRLSALPSEKAAGRVYRLPTAAEWEYACRAGTTTAYSFAGDKSKLNKYAWFRDNSGGKTHPVGSKHPNSWGLYDMHGNVWEWCHDWHGKSPRGSLKDPCGLAKGSLRVTRGGSWVSTADDCRSAYRNKDDPLCRYINSGFRVACMPSFN